MIKFVHKSFSKSKLDVRETDYVKYMISSCLSPNLISLVFKYIGYIIYIYFGNDYSFFDFVYLFFHALADSIIISILIFVSYGWTITFIKDVDFDLYVPLGNIVLLLLSLYDGTDYGHFDFIEQNNRWSAWQVSHVWYDTLISFGFLQIYHNLNIRRRVYQNNLPIKR